MFDTLPPYLAKYGYAAQSGSTWQVISEDSSGPPPEQHPQLELHITGHVEQQGHTLYAVECSLRTRGSPPLCWHVRRRLCYLRDALHDPVKAQLGDVYEEHFSNAPFAKKGGPPGTTSRLDTWVSALAACTNARGCSPSMLAMILHFFEVPEPKRVATESARLDSSPLPDRSRVSAWQDDTEQLMDEVLKETVQGLALESPKAQSPAVQSPLGRSPKAQSPKEQDSAVQAFGSQHRSDLA